MPNVDRAPDNYDRMQLAASKLLNPPADFGERSRQLPQELADYLDRQTVGNFDVLIDVFRTLATTPTGAGAPGSRPWGHWS